MFIYAILILLPAVAFTLQPLDKLEDILFGAIDANSDGRLSKQESVTFLQNGDANKDGELTLAEMTTAFASIDPIFGGYELVLFSIYDRDGNGQVNSADLDAFYSLDDANNDGDVDKVEFHIILRVLVILY